MLGSNKNGAYFAPHSKKCSKCTSLQDLTKDYKKRTTNKNLPIKYIKESTYKIWSIYESVAIVKLKMHHSFGCSCPFFNLT